MQGTGKFGLGRSFLWGEGKFSELTNFGEPTATGSYFSQCLPRAGIYFYPSVLSMYLKLKLHVLERKLPDTSMIVYYNVPRLGTGG